MKKTTIAILFLLLVALTFVSCGKEKAPSDIYIDPKFEEIDEYDMSLTKKGSANPLVTVPFLEHAVLNPWRENASKTAVETGTMRFYCMCATGHGNTPSWGDSCLIAFPNGELMLVDTGLDGFGPHLVRNLRALGVDQIDYLVLTHPHDDHTYGAIVDMTLMETIKIVNCYYGGNYNEGWSNPKKVEQVMNMYGVNLEVKKEGDSIDVGEVHIQWLAPDESRVGIAVSGNSNVNNLSMCMRFDWGEFSAMMAGDIEMAVEDRLLAQYGDTGLLDVDLFKVSHHGSDTSNQNDFIKAVSPSYVFCYGGAPISPSLYGRFAKLGAYVFCDGIDGYIRFVCEKNGTITPSTSHERETNAYVSYDKIAEGIRAKNATN